MTDQNYTHIVAVLDRSGSMASIAADTEGGFATFISEQKKVPGKCLVSLYQFDDKFDTVYVNKPISEISSLDLAPRGRTALIDAIGRSIISTGATFSMLPEDERPGVVLFVVLTDGFENASREFSAQAVREAVQEQTDKYNWQFIFLGSNQDAVLTGQQYGFNPGLSMTYAGGNVGAAFAAAGANTAVLRSAVANGVDYGQATMDAYFTDDQRAEAVDEV